MRRVSKVTPIPAGGWRFETRRNSGFWTGFWAIVGLALIFGAIQAQPLLAIPTAAILGLGIWAKYRTDTSTQRR